MFLFQYYRLVKGILKLRIVYAVVMGLVVAWSVAQILLTVLACIPISALWDSEVMKTAKCNSLGGAGQMWMTTVGSIVCDIIILVLPFPVVRKLQLPKTQKWFLFGIFSLGLVYVIYLFPLAPRQVPIVEQNKVDHKSAPRTCVVTSFRAVILSNSFMDLSWDSMGVVCITIAEPSSGLICAAIPTLRPLFIKIFPSMASQRSHTSTYRMYDYDSRTKPTLSSGVMNNYTRSPNDEIEFEDRASQKDLVKDIETGR